MLVIFFLYLLLVSSNNALLRTPTSNRRLIQVTPASSMRLFAGFALVSSKGEVEGKQEDDEEENRVLELTPESVCPCGSKLKYGVCCKPFHKDAAKTHDPISLIRSRYSAYSLENLDYVIGTTAASSPDYLAYIESPIGARNGRKKWVRDVKKNMIDSFAYVRMEIDGVEHNAEDSSRAVVSYRHLAIKKSDNVMYPILEKAYVVKTNGVWKYERGEVMRPDAEEGQRMMEEWPLLAGLELKKIAGSAEDADDGGAPTTPAERQPRPLRPAPKMGSVAPPQRMAKGKR